jgi:Family of unknown function (DUF5335)
MSVTKQVPHDRLANYFDAFTKRFLRGDSHHTVDVEVVSPDEGDQRAAHDAKLLGITYDLHANALEFELGAGDHRVYQPQEVWIVEEPDGFLSAVEVVRPDGAREIVQVKRTDQR